MHLVTFWQISCEYLTTFCIAIICFPGVTFWFKSISPPPHHLRNVHFPLPWIAYISHLGTLSAFIPPPLLKYIFSLTFNFPFVFLRSVKYLPGRHVHVHVHLIIRTVTVKDGRITCRARLPVRPYAPPCARGDVIHVQSRKLLLWSKILSWNWYEFKL